MDLQEVPQERNTTLDGQRKVVYAKDAQGRLRLAPSQGWEVEEIVTTQALSSLHHLSTQALEQVRTGQASSLAYWMHERRMDEALLAQSTGFWRWRVRRHLKPQPFASLSASQLERYAQALGLSVNALKTVPT
ncbi:hypothetical protein [Hydrogenophaga sp. PAMC20947]|uniref:hypothetical protein n=1 Tax=Hydrogenophaga sp. PAMC20947 TaxID=2565558 RepID=UPI00109E0135|nr:hypothetical protein [Hydrogenophaga sp. PAMC20947]QCB45005.1 hypothetical protein E5678_02535 [Hydrogenophaga sp. PAMC20947]